MTTVKAKPEMVLWLSDNRGVYIPQAYGRRSYGDLPDTTIGRALEESLRFN
jgi:hypothetical protein